MQIPHYIIFKVRKFIYLFYRIYICYNKLIIPKSTSSVSSIECSQYWLRISIVVNNLKKFLSRLQITAIMKRVTIILHAAVIRTFSLIWDYFD